MKKVILSFFALMSVMLLSAQEEKVADTRCEFTPLYIIEGTGNNTLTYHADKTVLAGSTDIRCVMYLFIDDFKLIYA